MNQVVRIPRAWRVVSLVLTVLWGFSSVGTMLLLIDGRKWILLAIVAVGCTFVEAVFARMAGVRLVVEPERLVVHNVFRTHRLPRKEIDDFDIGKSANPIGDLRTIMVRRGEQVVAVEAFAMPAVEEHLLEPVLDQFDDWRFKRR